MASTNKTTHFELGQFVGTDKPAWLIDYNGDMIKIDLALKSIQDLANGADAKATTSQSEVNTLENIVTGVLTDISLLNPYKEKVDNLEDEMILKSPINSPDFTGIPKVPTPILGERTLQVANTLFVSETVKQAFKPYKKPSDPLGDLLVAEIPFTTGYASESLVFSVVGTGTNGQTASALALLGCYTGASAGEQYSGNAGINPNNILITKDGNTMKVWVKHTIQYTTLHVALISKSENVVWKL